MEAFCNVKRGGNPQRDAPSPPSLKRARLDLESDNCPVLGDQDMEAPLAVTLSQSMDSVNTATGEEEVSLLFLP